MTILKITYSAIPFWKMLAGHSKILFTVYIYQFVIVIIAFFKKNLFDKNYSKKFIILTFVVSLIICQ